MPAAISNEKGGLSSYASPLTTVLAFSNGNVQQATFTLNPARLDQRSSKRRAESWPVLKPGTSLHVVASSLSNLQAGLPIVPLQLTSLFQVKEYADMSTSYPATEP
jgi:hypothetical protein